MVTNMVYSKFDIIAKTLTAINPLAVTKIIKDLKMTVYPDTLTVWRGIGYIVIGMHDKKKKKLQTAWTLL